MIALIRLVIAFGATALTAAAPTPSLELVSRSYINPDFANPSVGPAAISLDPNLMRDSCVSTTQLVDGRVFWICRDTQILTEQDITRASFPIRSSASWSNVTILGADLQNVPPSQGQQQLTAPFSKQLLQYGNGHNGAYFPYVQNGDECSADGNQYGSSCEGAQVVLYPNAPAYVVNSPSGATFMTAFIPVVNSTNGYINPNFQCSLYFLTYNHNADPNVMPTVNLINEGFFPRGAYCYGAYGGISNPSDGYLYLYGQELSARSVGLARVPLGSYLDISKYTYYRTDGTWTSTQPTINTTSTNLIASVPNEGQGTFFYSTYIGRYVWVGQTHIGASDGVHVGVSTSQNPYGPWTTVQDIAVLPHGNPYGYTVAAHPEMSQNSQFLYVSYTAYQQVNGVSYYTMPLYLFQWSDSSKFGSN
ncbi:hypothetical protein BD324DRAFT_635365 [Kockovaella imperatae]|uniref:DUF4185 domain-containing protein n=1 Tax=Kockovaella imperatae TaxID=4999 RepID=A0A1Y1UBJ6_9TREE|nr:hypothetical protein BD324DRAFT_635365 [Kockovaella imperatae]ORX34856.1 hypothetical protein BD324DRAFT_635365 [Kockovaella imperatae]